MANYNTTHWLDILDKLFPGLIVALSIAISLWLLIAVILKVFRIRRLLARKLTYLELTPPSQSDKTREATQRLFSVLHGLKDGRTSFDKVFGHQSVLSLEVTATREQGIRYIICAAESEVTNIAQTVATYLPDVRIKRIDTPQSSRGRVLDIKQIGHFAYPLHAHQAYDQHDPMAYLTGAMTKLAVDEVMTFQIVVAPVNVREAGAIAKRIFHNEELLYQLGRKQVPLVGRILGSINDVLFSILDSVGDAVSPSHKNYQPQQATAQHRQQVAMKIKPARVLSAFEQQLAEVVHDKLNQPLFRTSIRVAIDTRSRQAESERAKGIREWLALFNVPKYQSLKVRYNFPSALKGRYRTYLFTNRLPSFFSRSGALLSAAEIADLYHFPNTLASKTENVVKSLSKTLPAPLSLKGQTKFDVVLGRNDYHGAATDIGLTTQERERHVYIVGGTGHGKTTLMEYGIVKDIRDGKGVAVVDPHGDLAKKLLRYIPEDRLDDVIYFNPADLSYPIGLNLLELPEGLSDDELIEAKDFITESVISIMRKTFSEDDTGGHRIEYILRNSVQTALTVKDATIFTVFDLLTDGKYLKKITSTLEDEKLRNFWKNEFGKAGDFQRVKMAAGVTAKIGRFQFSAAAERIMSQPKSTINFEEILDGKILICNFAKGLIGEDTSALFGISTLAKLQLASYRRVQKRQEDRKPFYLYVDEFQNFATMSFVQMLSEARKYRLFLTMAEQSTSQQEDQRMVNTILANVGTVICFRSGNPADEKLLLPLFRPYLEEGDIANLPTHHFFARMSAVLSQEPVSGETLLLDDAGNEETAQHAIEASRANYATKYVKPAAKNKSSEPTKKKRQVKQGLASSLPENDA